MSTDITFEQQPDQHTVPFTSFARRDLDRVARAVAFAIGDPATFELAIDNAIRQAYRCWRQIGNNSDPERFIVGEAIRLAGGSAVAERGAVVATYLLGWSAADISRVFGLSEPRVSEVLNEADQHALETWLESAGLPVGDVVQDHVDHRAATALFRSQLRDAARSAEVVLPDVGDIIASERRRRLRGRVAITLAALAVGAAAGSFVTKANSTPIAPVIEQASESRQAVSGEPRPALVLVPHVVSSDGAGSFVGVQRAAFRNPATAIFSTSRDGVNWEFASRWELAEHEYVKRLEQVGDRYFAWVENALAPNPPNAIKLGISSDMISWSTLELGVHDRAPYGLIYSAEISDVAVNGADVLAVVRTEVRVEAAALALVESNSCGFHVQPGWVWVDPCNDALLEVFSTPDSDMLPGRNRLFLSRKGGPFVAIQAPFTASTDVQLSVVAQEFVLSDIAGSSFAASANGQQWRTVTD